jgi:MFS family permease
MARPRLRFLRSLLVDVAPLIEHRQFRFFFGSRLAFDGGRQLIIVALPLQIYGLTGSSLAVGLIGAVQLIPTLAVSLIGGALADSTDRRRLLVVGQGATGLCCLALMLYAGSNPVSTIPIYVLAALIAAVSAVVQPTRIAMIPTLVSTQALPSALALNQVLSNVTKAAVPALGGLMAAGLGLPSVYAVAACACAASALVAIRMAPMPPEGGGRAVGLESIREGFRYLRSNRLIRGALLIDLNAMVFGMPSALFPAWGTEVLGGDATTVGLLYSAPGVGALVAALTSGWLGRVRRQGRAVVVCVVAWGAAITAFGFTEVLWAALTLLLIAGAADVVSAVFRSSIIQLTAPDGLRGRVSAFHIATVSTGPRLGDLEAGVVATLTTPQISVVTGGVACAIGAVLVAKRVPELDAYQGAGLT